jgi:hypothetical protein
VLFALDACPKRKDTLLLVSDACPKRKDALLFVLGPCPESKGMSPETNYQRPVRECEGVLVHVERYRMGRDKVGASLFYICRRP